MKVNDITPWLEYFRLLNMRFVRNGILEVFPVTGETYITLPALYSLAGIDLEKDDNITKSLKISRTARQLRVYAEYLNANDAGYKHYLEQFDLAKDTPTNNANINQVAAEKMKLPKQKQYVASTRAGFFKTYALHVVDDTPAHNIISTILLIRKLHWWWPFTYITKFDVIEYKNRENN